MFLAFKLLFFLGSGRFEALRFRVASLERFTNLSTQPSSVNPFGQIFLKSFLRTLKTVAGNALSWYDEKS